MCERSDERIPSRPGCEGSASHRFKWAAHNERPNLFGKGRFRGTPIGNVAKERLAQVHQNDQVISARLG